MSLFRRGDKTQRISSLEAAIAKLASEIVAVKTLVEKVEIGIEKVQATLSTNHVEHTRCEGVQDGRWKEHLAEHKAMAENMAEVVRLVRKNTQNIQLLSNSIDRMAVADRQRQRPDA